MSAADYEDEIDDLKSELARVRRERDDWHRQWESACEDIAIVQRQAEEERQRLEGEIDLAARAAGNQRMSAKEYGVFHPWLARRAARRDQRRIDAAGAELRSALDTESALQRTTPDDA